MAAATTSMRTWRERRDVEQSDDAIDLMRFWREHEAAIGIRSNFGSMLAALEGMAPGGGPPAGWDPLADRVEEIGRCRRTWLVLREMDRRGQIVEIIALHRLYGDVMCPTGYRAAFGNLAQLASLTNAASTARDRLAYSIGSEREEAVAEPAARTVADNRARLEQDIERAVASSNRVVDQVDSLGRLIARDRANAASSPGVPITPRAAAQIAARPARLADLTRRLVAWDEHVAILQAAAQCDGVLRARLGALTSADREVSVDDAIQHMLHKTRHDITARSAFVDVVTEDARALKVRAHDAYKVAKYAQWTGRVDRGVENVVSHDPRRCSADVAEARVRGSGWSST